MNHIVKAKCRNCGCEAPADQFRLHHELRTMVCPTCFSGKPKPEEVKNVPSKPRDWDKEDEYLERARVKRQEASPSFKKIGGGDRLLATCSHCRYTFKYNPVKEMPKACPYCNKPAPKMKGMYF